MRHAWVLALVGGCGGGTAAPPSGGVLAYVDERGRVQVEDFTTGAREAYDSPLGTPGAISISLDGSQLAFTAQFDGGEPHAMVVDRELGTIREVLPPPSATTRYGWSGGRVFWYVTSSAGVVVVPYGAMSARTLGSGRASQPIASPSGPYLAFVECTTSVIPCPAEQLVLESGEGDIHQVLADQQSVPFSFTPDGGGLLASEIVDYAQHVVLYATGGRTDLGAFYAPFFEDTSRYFAADGSALLEARGPEMIEVPLDGRHELPVFDSSFAPWVQLETRAWMAPGIAFQTSSAPVDGVAPSFDLWLVRGADRQRIMTGIPDCDVFVPSPSRIRLLWSCADGVHLISLSAGEVVHTGPGVVLGFDAGERGFVMAEGAHHARGNGYELTYVDLDGGTRALGHVVVPPSEFPVWAYVP